MSVVSSICDDVIFRTNSFNEMNIPAISILPENDGQK